MREGRGVLLALLATAAAGGCRASRGGRAVAGALEITHAVVTASTGGEASAFFVVENHGDTACSLVGARADVTDSIRMHDDVGGQMQEVRQIAVPAGGRVLLAPGRDHLMLEGLRHPLVLGDTVALELLFTPGGPATVRAPVLRYTEAVSDLPIH